MTAAIYLRKSRAEEEIEDALQRHRDTLLEFAQKNKISIVRIYEEIVSGENLYMRPQMLELLSDIEKGLYEAVLCMDIDRLGRGAMSSQGLILETFKNADCKIITPRRVYDLNNELDEQYSEFEAFMARQEYKIITRRMRRGIIKSVESGAHIGEVPFGYRRVYVNKLPTLEIDEEKAKYVRMAFNLYAYQDIGCLKLSEMFTNSGISPKKSVHKDWNRTTILRMLRNPVYIGRIEWNRKKNIKKRKVDDKNKVIPNPEDKWIVVEDAHPPIIDKETFEKVQEIMQGHQHCTHFTGEFLNPLGGLVCCSKCGKLMQRQHQVSKDKYPRLLCVTKGCSKSMRISYLESGIIETLKAKLEDLNLGNVSKEEIDNSDLVKEFKAELSKVHQQMNKLYDLLEQGIYTIDVFTERSSALKSREAQIKTAISKFETAEKKVDYEKLSKQIEYVIENYFLTDSPNERNKMLKTVISKINYTREKDYKHKKFEISLEIKGI